MICAGMSKLLRMILIVPAVLGPIALARGVWALNQPWGITYQKIFALIFFFIFWVVSIFLLIQHKLHLDPHMMEKSKWLSVAMVSATFVVGGIFILATRPDEWIKAALATGFWALGFLIAVRELPKA